MLLNESFHQHFKERTPSIQIPPTEPLRDLPLNNKSPATLSDPSLILKNPCNPPFPYLPALSQVIPNCFQIPYSVYQISIPFFKKNSGWIKQSSHPQNEVKPVFFRRLISARICRFSRSGIVEAGVGAKVGEAGTILLESVLCLQITAPHV